MKKTLSILFLLAIACNALFASDLIRVVTTGNDTIVIQTQDITTIDTSLSTITLADKVCQKLAKIEGKNITTIQYLSGDKWLDIKTIEGKEAKRKAPFRYFYTQNDKILFDGNQLHFFGSFVNELIAKHGLKTVSN